MEAPIKQPFTNLQLELMKAFSFDLDEQELIKLKGVLALFFAQRAIEQANKTWDKEGWTDEVMDQMLATKMRSSKSSE